MTKNIDCEISMRGVIGKGKGKGKAIPFQAMTGALRVPGG